MGRCCGLIACSPFRISLGLHAISNSGTTNYQLIAGSARRVTPRMLNTPGNLLVQQLLRWRLRQPGQSGAIRSGHRKGICSSLDQYSYWYAKTLVAKAYFRLSQLTPPISWIEIYRGDDYIAVDSRESPDGSNDHHCFNQRDSVPNRRSLTHLPDKHIAHFVNS